MEACKRTDPGKCWRHHHRRAINKIGHFALIFGAAFLACDTLYSQDADFPVVISGEQYLQQFLDEVRTLQAEFSQELSDPEGQVVEIASGTMSIERPNRFLWLYRDPLEQLVLADGENLWIYDIELAQATVTPLSDVIEATPAMLLSGDEAVRDGFSTLENFSEDGLSWVRLAPNVSGSDFRSVLIGFKDGELARLELIDGLEQITRIEFSEVSVNQILRTGLFNFDLPDGVDVIGQRR